MEQPNSPAILLEQEQPSVDIQLGIEANPVAEGVFEVSVTATVHQSAEGKSFPPFPAPAPSLRGLLASRIAGIAEE